MTLRDVIAVAGARAHAVCLAILSLPEALPLPIAGLSAILAAPLIALSAHLVVFGSGRGIPDAITRRPIPRSLLRVAARRAAPLMKRLESLSRPRATLIARQDRLLGLACLVLAIIVALPIPFGNMAPAICLLAIALGMVQRDGLLVGAGLAGLAAIAVVMLFAFDLLLRLLSP